MKHWETALADFNRAIEGDPTIWWFWSWRGRIQGESKNWDAAIADCSRAIELFPLSATTWYNRGAAYSARAEWEQAVADYTRSAELDETDPPLFLRRAQALVQLNRFSEAASDYKTYLTSEPGDAGAWFQAAVVHARLGDEPASRDAYHRGLSLIARAGAADESLLRQRAEAERALAEAAAGGRISPAALRIPRD
jgi:tetratricopeptide (TPR) repeat protein